MDRKTREIAEKSFDIVERCKNELLVLCEEQSVSLVIAVMLAAANEFTGIAKDIRECYTERKSVWDLIKDVLKETRK